MERDAAQEPPAHTPVLEEPLLARPGQRAEPVRVFGRLEPLRIRDYWQDEARDFTPWLAKDDNLALLGETIGMNLQLLGTEQRVGPFKADLVATADGEQTVIVENQLDPSDHKHLGQLLVYAAGRRATTVVWIAKQVTDEYRKVIDWLNEETTTNFWALEIELWQIGDSLPAPKFNVVCEPNELSKPPSPEAPDLTETKLLQLEFWKSFADFLETSGSSFNAPKAFPQHWYNLAIGTSSAYISLTALVAKSRVGCELTLPDAKADAIFGALEADKEEIERRLGELEWEPLPEKKSSRISVYRDADIRDRETWHELFAWLKDHAERFKSTFAPRVKQVAAAPVPPVPDLEEALAASVEAREPA